jgi:hypothetical protein
LVSLIYMPQNWRILLFSLGCYVVTISADAQKFTVGVKVGSSFHWSNFGDKPQKDTFSTGSVYGYGAGFQIGFPLKKEYQLMIEGGYSKKGRALKFDRDRWVNRSFYNMIDGNMLLRKSYKFHIAKNVPTTWFFELGPEINYVLNGYGSVTVNNGTPYSYKIVYDKAPDQSIDKMFYSNANRWLFGLIGGVGFKAPLKNNHHIAVQLRFISGHTWIGKKKSSSTIGLFGFEDTLKTNIKTISASIAYTLDFDVQQSRKGKSTLDKQIKRR